MKKSYSLLLLILLLSAFSGMCQQSINWSIKPQIDTVTNEMTTNNEFIVTSNGLKGYYKIGSGLLVPTEYNELIEFSKLPIGNGDYDESIELDIAHQKWLLIKQNNLYGIYSIGEGKLILDIKYETIKRNGSSNIDVKQSSIVKQVSIYEFYKPYEARTIEPETMSGKNGPAAKINDFGIPNNITKSSKNTNQQTKTHLGKSITIIKELENGLTIVQSEENGLFGVLNTKANNYLIPCKYYRIYKSGRYLEAYNDGKYQLIDPKDGKTLSPPYTKSHINSFDQTLEDELNKQYILCQTDSSEALLDSNYSILIPFTSKYVNIGFHPYLAGVKTNKNTYYSYNLKFKKPVDQLDSIIYSSSISASLGKKNNNYYIYNPSTDKIHKVDVSSLTLHFYMDSVVVVKNKKGKFQLLNLNQQAFSNAFDSIGIVYSKSVNIEGTNNLLKSAGVGFAYEDNKNVRQFFTFYKKNTIGLLNRNGQILLENTYDSVIAYTEVYHFIHTEKIPSEYLCLYKNGKIDLYDANALKMVHKDLQQVKFYKSNKNNKEYTFNLWFQQHQKWGYVSMLYLTDSSDAKYDEIIPLANYNLLKIGQKFQVDVEDRSILNKKVEYKYVIDSFKVLPNNFLRIYSAGKTGILNEKGKLVIDVIYESVEFAKCPVGDLCVKLYICKSGNETTYCKYGKYKFTVKAGPYIYAPNDMLWVKVAGKWGAFN